MIDVIKEYLISIGFDVNAASFKKAQENFGVLDKTIQNFQKGLAKNKEIQAFTKNLEAAMESAGEAVAAFGASYAGLITAILAGIAAFSLAITAAAAAFMNKMGQADMQVQKFALSLYTTVGNARSLQGVMNAMGLKSLDDLKYVNLIPEQREQFLALRKLANQMALSGGEAQGFKNIRSAGYQTQQTQLIVDYFWQKLAGEMGIGFGPLIQDFNRFLQGMNKYILAHATQWAQALTRFFVTFGYLAEATLKFVGWVTRIFGAIFGPSFTMIGNLLNIIMESVLLIELWITGQWKPGGSVQKGVGKITKDDQRHVLLSDKQFNAQTLALHKAGQDKRAGDLIFRRNALQAAGMAMPTVDMPTGKAGDLFWGTKDAHSANIDGFMSRLKGALHSKYTVTAGMTSVGHLSHGSGNAFDIGLGGRSDHDILSLMKSVLSTPGLKMADLELPRARFASILRQMDKAGINYKGRVVDQGGPYRTGDNLHVGLTPATITININGAGHPHAVAEAVHHRLQPLLSSRNLRGPHA